MDRNDRLEPALAPGHVIGTRHFVDNTIYTDEQIFEEELTKIHSKVWKFVCHESELLNTYDYRTVQVARVPLIVTRGSDRTIRAFINTCSHRGAKVVHQPRGNARLFECMFHRWAYDTRGQCTEIPRQEGYASIRLQKEACGLKAVRTETMLGLVFVNLDPEAPPLAAYLGSSLELVKEVLASRPLEVFHFHEQVVHTNWKHWHETNMELYHEYLHVLNRRTSMGEKHYFERKWRIYAGGHAGIEPFVVDYAKQPGGLGREDALPGLKPNEFRLVDVFPDLMINCRASVVRLDVQVPLDANTTLVQFRGLGLRGEAAHERMRRIKDHNQFWGPFGRNLPEDGRAAELQQRAMQSGRHTYSLWAREENLKTTDDEPVRAYYDAWKQRMGRDPAAPLVA